MAFHCSAKPMMFIMCLLCYCSCFLRHPLNCMWHPLLRFQLTRRLHQGLSQKTKLKDACVCACVRAWGYQLPTLPSIVVADLDPSSCGISSIVDLNFLNSFLISSTMFYPGSCCECHPWVQPLYGGTSLLCGIFSQ
jgi:hypothetical protein